MQIDSVAVARVRHLVTNKPGCQNCFCHWSCAGGCHVKHPQPGDRRSDDYCIQTRIITACSLLIELGQDALVNDLLENRTAMETLAVRPSDFLEDATVNHD
jgi:hypothetical protein